MAEDSRNHPATGSLSGDELAEKVLAVLAGVPDIGDIVGEARDGQPEYVTAYMRRRPEGSLRSEWRALMNAGLAPKIPLEFCLRHEAEYVKVYGGKIRPAGAVHVRGHVPEHWVRYERRMVKVMAGIELYRG